MMRMPILAALQTGLSEVVIVPFQVLKVWIGARGFEVAI